MKNALYCFVLLFLLLSCSGGSKGVKVAADIVGKELQLDTLEREMIDFFQSTLEKNYGDRYAVELLIKGLRKYDYNYVLDVDKQRLKEINRKLYGDGWFASYFFDAKHMNDSALMVVPKGMTIREYRNSARFLKDLKKKGIDSTEQINFYRDSLEYEKWRPLHQRMENIAFYMIMYPKNGVSYYRNELSRSSHQALKETAEEMTMGGDALSSEAILRYIESNRANVLSDFKSDRDVQMLLTLYFWKYLCHSANIDFRTGEDRTEAVMKEAR